MSLSNAQIEALYALAEIGRPQWCGEIGRHLGMSFQTATSTLPHRLNGLADKGFVSRETRREHHTRRVYYALTDRGRALLEGRPAT